MELPQLIQEFLISYSCYITLEEALKLTIFAQTRDEDLKARYNKTQSTITALNQFAAKVDRKEIWKFVRLINQNHLTGSTSTISALEKYHDELWNQKLTTLKKKSEKVSIQLTFLLMLSLISVVVVVMTPVMLLI